MRIEIKNLSKVYGSGPNSVLALNDLNLEVKENEICIVRGPNGSGKSTLISILSGELSPTVGSVKLSSQEVKSPAISVITQFHNLVEELTVAEHFLKLNRTENIHLIDETLLDKKPSQISRGQAQIIAIALALNSNTDLLLADEPTGALGHEDSKRVYEFIKETAPKNNCAVVLVTHDQDAEVIADRVVRLQEGRISETWKPGEPVLQVVSESGWVRIPDQVLAGLSDAVKIDANETGGSITGRKHSLIESNELFKRVPQEDSVLLKVNDLETRYGSNQVFSGISFSLNEADLLCVYGKSGSGKTTFLKTICGFHKEFSGELINNLKFRIPYFNIENIYGLELSLIELIGNSPFISKLQLEEISGRPLKTYSGGQKQRALIAMALSSTEPVIAIDEPTSALDEQMSRLVIKVIVESTKTVIISSHEKLQPGIATKTISLN